ncbi:MAG: protein kinase [Bythopirellula sp.]|nr:protein kinase [Bythopirellula sp.]
MSTAPHHKAAELVAFDLANQIDIVCDAFEQAWQRGEEPSIATYLEGFDPAARDSLLSELLLVDHEFRTKRGEAASRDDYLRRYPEYSALIQQVDFSTVGEDAQETLREARRTGASHDAAGSQFADFQLLEELGAGASGTVWKARDLRLRRLVALKLPRQQQMNAAERARFRREGQACAQLDHPHIVTVYGVGEHERRLYIASEFIDGWSLREWLAQQRRISPLEAVTLTAQLAEALQHAHEKGVIHRDLKPANVLIDRAGKPFVTDFGLAKWTDQSVAMTLEGHVLGTPAYMSPEQARGDSLEVDRRSDVYGLGAMFYEMLTGKPPFEGEVATVIHHVIHEEPTAPLKLDAKIPRDLETICLKAMQKVPAERYPSMQALANDLRRYLAGEPILARRANLLEQSWRLVKRRRALAGMLAAALVAVTAGGFAAMLAEQNHELRGFRTVSLATDPPGARVAFVPLSTETGEPELHRRVLAKGFSPVEVDLLPGDYFVVAVLEDGRFHEVYRRVPKRGDLEPRAGFNHLYAKRLLEDQLQLEVVRIPAEDIAKGMTRIEGSENFPFGFSGSREIPPYTVSIAPFFIDNLEFSNADGTALCKGFHAAVQKAEELGKRLPSEAEYEFVATNQGTTKYPWGDDWPAAADQQPPSAPADPFGPLGQPEFDRVAMYPAVKGLVTNKAEWTIPRLLPSLFSVSASRFRSLDESRIYRGGSELTIAGDPRNTPADRDPRQRREANEQLGYPGLGFRCVRSAEPLVSYAEFE